MNVPGYSYETFRAAIAERDGWSCHVHRVLVARREAVIERWRAEGYGDVDRCAGWVPTGLLRCDGELDGHHLLSKSWLKREYPGGAWASGGAIDTGRANVVQAVDAVRTLADLLNDPRNAAICCRRHHDLIEGPTEAVKLWRTDLPPCAEEFTAELGAKAVARLERNFGLRPSAGERAVG